MGGAQPLAVTMNDGVCIAIEVDEARARRRHEIGYVDRLTDDPSTRRWAGRAGGRARRTAAVDRARRQRRRRSSPPGRRRGERFDVVTDQTSAHDALVGYVPAEISLADAAELRAAPARGVRPAVDALDGRPRPGDARLPGGRLDRLRLRQQPPGAGEGRRASRTPSTTRASCPRSSGRSSARAAGPFRWAALSGDPADILRTDRAILELFPDDAGLRRWIEMAEAKVPFQGPAGADLLARLRRAGEGRAGVQRAGPNRRGVGARS